MNRQLGRIFALAAVCTVCVLESTSPVMMYLVLMVFFFCISSLSLFFVDVKGSTTTAAYSFRFSRCPFDGEVRGRVGIDPPVKYGQS